MAGKKGRSGGARTPRNPATAKKRGPLIRSNRDAPLDSERARSLKVLIIARGWEYTPETVRTLLNELIDAAWEEYERPILEDAEGLVL